MQHQRLHHRRALIAAAAALVAVVPLAAASFGTESRGVSYSAQIQPIFDAKCTACHPVSYPYLDLRRGRSYEQLVRISAATAPAFERVLPGRPELSYVLTHPPDPSLRELLTPAERRLIAVWIQEGARDN